MTQIKLWQIVSQTPNTIIFSDSNGNLTSLPAGTANQVLVIGLDGKPTWVENTALATALEAKTDVTNALAAARSYTETQIAALVDNAPLALNTLNELAIKLNNEDSAINALLLQVDGKADTISVVTQVAQAKLDAINDSHAYADNAVGTVISDLTGQIATAKNDAIAVAAEDALLKAVRAENNVLGRANDFTMFEISQAVSNASVNATAQVDALENRISQIFRVEGTATAVYIASSLGMDANQATNQGVVVAEAFTELTGAPVSPLEPTLNAKLLFVNGVAISGDWQPNRVPDGPLLIKFSPALAQKIFDGTVNTIMILAEYLSHRTIIRA